RADEATRLDRRRRIGGAFDALRRAFPDIRLSDDSHARISDLAIDIGEAHRLPARMVADLEESARALGMRTFVSSVHLHLTLDPFDKATGTVAFLHDRFAEDPTSARQSFAYVGDSSNDAPCFFAFATSFGVANVAVSLPRLSVPPRYVSPSPKGEGFAEIAARILALRY
ncbi:MAG TPA: hypothetical protein VJT73_04725, partial [Polyangiaceae bacterium]|nr:hypothetical protein [Polyangiaceae bacterium]